MEGLIVVIPVNASTGVGLSDPKTYQNSKFIIVKCCNLSIHKITRKYWGNYLGLRWKILRIQKPEEVKCPKIFVWLDLPRKRIKTKNNNKSISRLAETG